VKFKDVKMLIKSVTDQGLFTGYASTFGNEDLGGDIIVQGAFAKTITENPNVPILWGHSSKEVIGVNKIWSEDSKGLAIEGELNMDVQRARETHSLMKQGAVKGLSIGYDSIIEDWSRWEKEGIRVLREVKVWEYSVTPFPMNPEAQVTGVKSFEDLEQALRTVMTCTGQEKLLQRITADQKSALIEPAVKRLSALLAAGLPAKEAATQYSSEPGIHSLVESIQQFKFQSLENRYET
jgi:HK97 family phage prohead protease